MNIMTIKCFLKAKFFGDMILFLDFQTLVLILTIICSSIDERYCGSQNATRSARVDVLSGQKRALSVRA
ncbi:Uncharacterized protein BM_BM17934 [Brugia malayi]|uniref:Uncharacterized protein n=1 Tax=Brugia malayi TaxID=6279 RepID=A0A4E9EVQ2_BRUMA|nr:Uncharacterized protein BM_BM17934 [Brugia malayi]VIO86857.1 Uncharacterized protein BM_BM17934 [Brugia malayi]